MYHKGQEKPARIDAHPIWSISDIQPPKISMAEARELAFRLYGVSEELSPLPSERDQIFRVPDTTSQQYVLRISGSGEQVSTLNFQNRALIEIQKEDPSLPVTKLCPSVRGRYLEQFRSKLDRFAVRLLTFVPGVPILNRRRSFELYRDIGSSLARLNRALVGLTAPPKNPNLLWDIRRATRLRPLLVHLSQYKKRNLVEAVFDELDRHIFKRLETLRSQVIHNDFNPKNILIDLAAPDRVSGIIDFGDLTYSPRVVDLGVAIARNIELTDTLPAACELVAGYHSVLPLSDEEISILFDLVCTRLALRAVVWSWRHSKEDPRCDPNQISLAINLLETLSSAGKERVTAIFRAACGADRPRWRA